MAGSSRKLAGLDSSGNPITALPKFQESASTRTDRLTTTSLPGFGSTAHHEHVHGHEHGFDGSDLYSRCGLMATPRPSHVMAGRQPADRKLVQRSVQLAGWILSASSRRRRCPCNRSTEVNLMRISCSPMMASRLRSTLQHHQQGADCRWQFPNHIPGSTTTSVRTQYGRSSTPTTSLGGGGDGHTSTCSEDSSTNLLTR